MVGDPSIWHALCSTHGSGTDVACDQKVSACEKGIDGIALEILAVSKSKLIMRAWAYRDCMFGFSCESIEVESESISDG